jgi:ectoine hydroxylase-related dioxygenase (phytanoyl-CoA dioxygenase family)
LYSIIICLDEFNIYNGATEYIPGSHKSYKTFKRQQNKKKIRKILGDKGDLIFLHGNLLHKVGKNLRKDMTRWSIFAFYTPWWVKPSTNYKKLMNKYHRKLGKLDKKILHFDSTPYENMKDFSLELKNPRNLNSKKK